LRFGTLLASQRHVSTSVRWLALACSLATLAQLSSASGQPGRPTPGRAGQRHSLGATLGLVVKTRQANRPFRLQTEALANSPTAARWRDQDGRRLLAALARDPLFRSQGEASPYESRRYAQDLVDAIAAYRRATGNVRASVQPSVTESVRDLVEAMATGPGQVATGMSALGDEIALLRDVVARARKTGHALSLGQVVELALHRSDGEWASALRLSTNALKHVVRATSFYLAYAHANRISPDSVGLHTEGLRFSTSAGIGFMARYVVDPSGKAYGLLGEPARGEKAGALRHRLLVPEDLAGIPYHALDLMRLALSNRVLPAAALGRVLRFYYDTPLLEIGLRYSQLPDKAEQDERALRGAQQVGAQAGPDSVLKPSRALVPRWLAERVVWALHGAARALARNRIQVFDPQSYVEAVNRRIPGLALAAPRTHPAPAMHLLEQGDLDPATGMLRAEALQDLAAFGAAAR
jgi:hypothetical protein